jgi:site-specific recombinase XerD
LIHAEASPMSVRFRAERGKWEACVYVDGERIRGLFDSKKEAKEFEKTLWLRKGKVSEEFEPIPIAKAFQDFLDTTSSFKLPASKVADERYFRFAVHFFTKVRGHSYISKVGPEDLELFYLWVAQPQEIGVGMSKEAWTAPTVANCMKNVKSVFLKLFRNECIKRNPAAHIRTPRGVSVSPRPMTLEEFKTIYAIAPLWLRRILLFLRLSGARPIGCARVRMSDVDFAAGTLTLRSLKGRGRVETQTIIPMYPALHNLMTELRNESVASGYTDDFLFRDRNARPVSARVISKAGERLIKKAGLSGVVIYSLRHAIGAELTAAGVSLELVRQTLGHSNIQQTSQYARGAGLAPIRDALTLIRGGEDSPPDDDLETDSSVNQTCKPAK